MRQPIWSWLKRQDNRDVVKMVAAALAAVVAGGWAIFTFAVDHGASPSISASSDSVAAGHDATGNRITNVPPAAPKAKPQ